MAFFDHENVMFTAIFLIDPVVTTAITNQVDACRID